MKQYKIFLTYVIPSVLAFALSSVYAIVDGFFIGNTIGDIGLSSVNIVYPIVTFIQSAGTGIGIGGSVLWSIKKTTHSEETANNILLNMLLLLLLSGIFTMLFFYSLLNPILKLLGAEGQIFSLCREYLQIIIAGTFFQIFATGLVPIIRNNGSSTFAMLTMVIGFLSNMFLDYLLVWIFHLGMTGAAFATIIGQAITMAVCFIYLFHNRMPVWKAPISVLSNFKETIKIGIAPFGLSLSPMISLMLINRFSLSYGGEQAVACYACISYALSVVYFSHAGSWGRKPALNEPLLRRGEKH